MIINDYYLTTEHIEALANSEERMVVIQEFVSSDLCHDVGSSFASTVRKARSSGSEIYRTNALPFFNAIESQDPYDIYFAHAVEYMNGMRKVSQPYPYPADTLRLALDEIWAGGAQLLTIEKQKTLFGICRIWKEGSEGLPHQDVLRRELPANDYAERISCQFGANIYLTTPKEGGELRVWSRIVEDDEWQRLDVPGSYGYPCDVFDGYDFETYKPRAGDLVLINTAYIHSILPTISGERVTISGFGAITTSDESIKLWS